MDKQIFNKVKIYIEEVIYLNEIEEKILRKRDKLDWLRMGDERNAFFFHASIKAKQNAKSLNHLIKADGSTIRTHHEIEREIMEFYGQLMGKLDNNITHIDIEAMIMGNQLSIKQREQLVRSISEQDITKALKGMGDLKSPGIDDYEARFFKAN
ncbi:unnamed protein product [Lathyrus sativus]|nr:unnamed protein product [Lathyrus sativus]